MSKKKVAENQPFEDEAAALLKAIGPWVELKTTFPSSYREILKATQKFLADFKDGKIEIKKKSDKKSLLPAEGE
jgi:hypothetical protein